jgi:hypothetical protein
LSRSTLSHRWRIARSLSVAAVRLTTPRGWRALEEELDAWRYSGRKAVMWWRDDDAVQQTASIDHLFAMGNHFAIPIALAVIPAKVNRSLARVVQGRDVTIFQHGWDHTNHALPGAYKAELAVGRAAEEVREQLWKGWGKLVSLFADRLLPVLVPPFNQLDPNLAHIIHAAYPFVSLHSDFNDVRITSVNVHCNIMDWGTGDTVPEDTVALQLVTALRLRRYHLVRLSTPIGILTHHLDHTDTAWSLLDSLLTRLRRHDAVCFPAITEVFPIPLSKSSFVKE